VSKTFAKSALQIGRFAGIKISVHWTFLILLVWIVYANAKSEADTVAILWSIGFTLSIFGCVVLHEFGHALMAKHFHINTRDITLYPIGGVARLESMPKKPKEELLVALAGPVVNVLISGVLTPFVNTDNWSSAMVKFTEVTGHNFLFAFITVNIWLAVFNLIPAFPMDGGRVLRALLAFRLSRVQATRIAAGLGQLIALLFMLIGLYANPFLIFIGVFIFLGAQAESSQAQTEAMLEGKTLDQITMHHVPTLSTDTAISLVVNLILDSQKKNFVVEQEGKVAGALGQHEVIKCLRERGEDVPVGDVMDTDILFLSAEMPLEESLKQMQLRGKQVAVVVNQTGERVGMVDTDNLVEFIMIQNARQQFKDHQPV
jgi:Zn-dependent protease